MTSGRHFRCHFAARALHTDPNKGLVAWMIYVSLMTDFVQSGNNVFEICGKLIFHPYQGPL